MNCRRPSALSLNLVLFFLGGLSLCPISAKASSVTLTFSANVDATAFGLTSSEPLVFQVNYDPATPANPGSNSTFTLPIDLSVGGYTISETGVISITMQPTFDAFSLGAAGYVVGDSLSGSINGTAVWIGSLDIVDNIPPIDMLNSTSLPVSPDFITNANIISVDIENFSGTDKIIQTFGPGEYALSISSVPEPSSLWMSGVGMIMLMLAHNRRKSARD